MNTSWGITGSVRKQRSHRARAVGFSARQLADTYIGVQPLGVPLSELQAEKTAPALWPRTNNPADPTFLQLLHPIGCHNLARICDNRGTLSAVGGLDRFVRSGGRY